MAKEYLKSSTLKYVEYDRSSRTLSVAFPDKSTKTFKNVPHEIYEALLASATPGTYYHDYIEGKF